MAGQSGSIDQPVAVRASTLQWQDAVGFTKGARLAVVYGDMTKPGPFVARLALPANFKIAPHWHSKAEYLSISSGSLRLGQGDRYDLTDAALFGAGDFLYQPAGHRHFLLTTEPTVVELYGSGPFDINYINAADDPRHG